MTLRAWRDAEHLDSAIAGQDPLPFDLVLWRAIGSRGLDRLLAGVVDRGFTSASTSRSHVVDTYVTSRASNVLLSVTVSRGVRVLHMPSVGSGGTLSIEDEVLLPRGAALTVVRRVTDALIEVTFP